MNLHSIVSPLISAVNPPVTATLQASTGYTTSPDGRRVPAYATPVTLIVQKQPLQSTDLQQIAGLNITGTKCKLYLSGSWQGVIRATQEGGDLVTLPDASVWLVVMVLEDWAKQDGWTSVACVLQDGS